jgi:hypothetical protein
VNAAHSKQEEQRRRGTGAAALVLGLTLCCGFVMGQESAPSESQLKAAFMVNFPKYVDWPPSVFVETNSPIVVGIFGVVDFEEELEKMIVGRSVDGRALVFRKVSTEKEIAGCHVLFIGGLERRRMVELMGVLEGASVLTVGDSDDFLDLGGVIKLVRRARKVRLEVNLGAASRVQLKISSKLLGVADVVKGRSE